MHGGDQTQGTLTCPSLPSLPGSSVPGRLHLLHSTMVPAREPRSSFSGVGNVRAPRIQGGSWPQKNKKKQEEKCQAGPIYSSQTAGPPGIYGPLPKPTDFFLCVLKYAWPFKIF